MEPEVDVGIRALAGGIFYFVLIILIILRRDFKFVDGMSVPWNVGWGRVFHFVLLPICRGVELGVVSPGVEVTFGGDGLFDRGRCLCLFTGRWGAGVSWFDISGRTNVGRVVRAAARSVSGTQPGG